MDAFFVVLLHEGKLVRRQQKSDWFYGTVLPVGNNPRRGGEQRTPLRKRAG